MTIRPAPAFNDPPEPDFSPARPAPDFNDPRYGVMSSLDSDPPKGSLINLTTGDEFQFQFNPATLEEAFEAKFNRKQINGLSHEPMSYKNTSNNVIPLELYMSQLMQDVKAGHAGSRPYIATERKRWLQSLVYPAESPDYGYVGPPKVLFIWPRMVRIIGRVTKVGFVHRAFSNRTLATTQLVARLSIEEDVAQRRLMDEVLRIGSMAVSVETEAAGRREGG